MEYPLGLIILIIGDILIDLVIFNLINSTIPAILGQCLIIIGLGLMFKDYYEQRD